MKDICPICSSQLLRQIQQKELSWFCCRCRQSMPNFAAEYIINLQSKQSLRQRVKVRVKQYSHSIVELQPKSDYDCSLVNESWSWLESFIEEGKIRLDIVSFIITKTKSIINNALIVSANLNSKSLEDIEESPLEKRQFTCLRDAEIILLYICNAILQRNAELLKNQYFKDLKASYTALNIPIYQKISVINLMKNSVMSFVNHRTLNFLESASKYNYFDLTSEIASYFDTVIDCLT